MSQDITSDALNQMMNAMRARKTSLTVKRHSQLLISVLAIAKLKGYVHAYKVEGTSLTIELGRLNGCCAIKPRFFVKQDEYDKYVKRYLPARNIGIVVVSTNEGLMTHTTAEEKKKGGSLIAYFF
ncbi:MAG: 30S ribosomal protein S8 [Nanoarchaeota archaeon]|mgnify:CR=1 FL=1